MSAYWRALVVTLAIEMPVYSAALRGGFRIAVPQGLFLGMIVNFITHPLAFLVVMPRLAPALGSYVSALAVVELGVWGVEAGLLWCWLRREPELLGLDALLANILSFSIGLAVLG